MTEWVVVCSSRTDRTCYHTRECGRQPERSVELPKQRAKQSGLDECQYCAGEITYPEENDMSYYQAALNHE